MVYIPSFLDDRNPAPAKEQLDHNYAHGGGWKPFNGFKMNMKDHSIKYPGDPAFGAYACIKMRDEEIYVYPHGWVAIVQKDGSYEIARMD